MLAQDMKFGLLSLALELSLDLDDLDGRIDSCDWRNYVWGS